MAATEFTAAESDLLARYFTNLDRPVFALRNLPEVVKGALFSRYSRTEKSLRRVLLDEFINAPESGFSALAGKPSDDDDMVAVHRAGQPSVTAFPDGSKSFADTASEGGTSFMLPGFRFLFAATLLTISMLIFGLGAAALLRAAHQEFASIPSRRAPPGIYYQQTRRSNDACAAFSPGPTRILSTGWDV